MLMRIAPPWRRQRRRIYLERRLYRSPHEGTGIDENTPASLGANPVELQASRQFGSERLFFFGEELPAGSVFSTFPEEIADTLLKSGMLQHEANVMLPAYVLVLRV